MSTTAHRPAAPIRVAAWIGRSEYGFLQVALWLALGIATAAPYVAMHPSVTAALANAHRIMRLEHDLGIGVELTAQRAARSLGLVGVFNALYLLSQLVVTWALVVALYVRDRAGYAIARNVILGSSGAALLVFLLYPVAPPHEAGEALRGLALNPHGGYGFDTLAAMPSLHCACATGVAIGYARSLTRCRWLPYLWPLLVAVCILVTGNHYVLDAVAGCLLAELIALGLRYCARRPETAWVLR